MIEKIKLRITENFKLNETTLDFILCCLFSNSHLLLTDNPGTGKTTLSKVISDVFSLNYGRVQCTPDLSPADISGMNIYNLEDKNWNLHKGPLFNNIVLVDEINRTLPRTQSAFLEAMAEKQVTIDNKTYPLSENFFVIATRNNYNEEGCFELPAAQKDRFSMNLSLDQISRESEKDIILGKMNYEKQSSLISQEELIDIKREVSNITINDKVVDYILDILTELRKSEELKNKISIRVGKDLVNNAKALAYINSDKSVLPDHVFSLLYPVLNHRIQDENYDFNRSAIEKIIIEKIKHVKV